MPSWPALLVLLAVLCTGCQTTGRSDGLAVADRGSTVLVLLPSVFNGSSVNEVYPAGDRQTPETMRRRIAAMLSIMRSKPFDFALQVERVPSPYNDRLLYLDRSFDGLVWTKAPFTHDKVIWFKARKGEFGNSLLFVDDLRSPYRQKEWSEAVGTLKDGVGET